MGVSQRGYDTEIFAKKILESEGFEVIFAPEEEKRKSQNLKNVAHVLCKKSNNVISTDVEKIFKESKEILKKLHDQRHQIRKVLGKEITFDRLSAFDYFCKKNNKYYVIEIKRKENSSDEITLTHGEIETYSKIHIAKKAIVKLLVIKQVNKKIGYLFYDWNDLSLTFKFNPKKKYSQPMKAKDHATIIPINKIQELGKVFQHS